MKMKLISEFLVEEKDNFNVRVQYVFIYDYIWKKTQINWNNIYTPILIFITE